MKSRAASTVVEKITRYNVGRDPDRLALKYQALAANPFSFLRGTCHLFYDELPEHPLLRDAPSSWICGDLHLENFGTYKGDNRLVYFDINDFDEAVLAPCSWEIVRLLTSILVAAPTLSMKQSDAKTLAGNCIDCYAKTLASGKSRWIDRDAANGLICDLFQRLAGRKRKDYIESRTVAVGKRREIRTDKGKGLPATEEEKHRIGTWLKKYAESKESPAFFAPIDIARRIAGTGSLGVDRFMILIQGKGGVDGNYLLDLKASQASCLAGKTPISQPRWASEAMRIVTVGSQMQAIPPAFLDAVDIEGHPYVLKGLQPSQDRVDLQKNMSRYKQLDQLICNFGALAAWSQVRSSGHGGSATADALVMFAQDQAWIAPMLDIAEQLAEQVHRDWAEFAEQAKDGIAKLLAQSASD